MKTTRKELERIFNEYKSNNIELKCFSLIYSDKRFSNSVALGNYSNGTLFLKTNYYSYSEIIAFLDGYLYFKGIFSK